MIKTWLNFMEYRSRLTGVCNRSGLNLKNTYKPLLSVTISYVLYSNLNILESFIVFSFKLFNLCLHRTISTPKINGKKKRTISTRVDNKIIQDQIKISLVLLSCAGPQAHK